MPRGLATTAVDTISSQKAHTAILAGTGRTGVPNGFDLSDPSPPVTSGNLLDFPKDPIGLEASHARPKHPLTSAQARRSDTRKHEPLAE